MDRQPHANSLLALPRVKPFFWVVLFTLLSVSIKPFAAGSDLISSEGYLIGPEDVLHISVWKEEELNREEVVVPPDGKIAFPLAGVVQAAGRTVGEIQREITERIRKYIPDPVVTVSVHRVSGYKVYVLGKVNNPGEFVVGRYIDVLQALTLAGGLDPYASENNIKILRRENGKETALPFKYGEVKGGKNLGQNIILKSGDVVVVP